MSQHGRKSLVDDSFESVGKQDSKKKSAGSGSGVKIGIIVVCLALAGVLLAYNFGIIPNPFEEKPKPTVFTPEDNTNIQNYQKQTETLRKQNASTEGGS